MEPYFLDNNDIGWIDSEDSAWLFPVVWGHARLGALLVVTSGNQEMGKDEYRKLKDVAVAMAEGMAHFDRIQKTSAEVPRFDEDTDEEEETGV